MQKKKDVTEQNTCCEPLAHKNSEVGMRKAETLTFNPALFRIPHSDFHIHLPPLSVL